MACLDIIYCSLCHSVNNYVLTSTRGTWSSHWFYFLPFCPRFALNHSRSKVPMSHIVQVLWPTFKFLISEMHQQLIDRLCVTIAILESVDQTTWTKTWLRGSLDSSCSAFDRSPTSFTYSPCYKLLITATFLPPCRKKEAQSWHKALSPFNHCHIFFSPCRKKKSPAAT